MARLDLTDSQRIHGRSQKVGARTPPQVIQSTWPTHACILQIYTCIYIYRYTNLYRHIQYRHTDIDIVENSCLDINRSVKYRYRCIDIQIQIKTYIRAYRHRYRHRCKHGYADMYIHISIPTCIHVL